MSALAELQLHGLSELTAEQLVQRIWALGPRNCGTNILLNLSDYEQPDFWSPLSRSSDTDVRSASDARKDFNSSLVNGFQLTSGAGPLCEEPMQGVCFAVLEWSVQAEGEDLNARSFGPFSGESDGVQQVFSFSISISIGSLQDKCSPQPRRSVVRHSSCSRSAL